MTILLLDPKVDQFKFKVRPDGTELVLDLTPEQMQAVSVWAFARKITHIIEGRRIVEPFAIPQGERRWE